MKDFVGNTLHVGDKVVYAYRDANKKLLMVQTTITKILQKLVCLDRNDFKHSVRPGAVQGVPYHCVKYVEPGTAQKDEDKTDE